MTGSSCVVCLNSALVCLRCYLSYLITAFSLCNCTLQTLSFSSLFHLTFPSPCPHSSNIHAVFYAPSLAWLFSPPSLYPLSSSLSHLLLSNWKNSILTLDSNLIEVNMMSRHDRQLSEQLYIFDFAVKIHYWYIQLRWCRERSVAQ